MCCYTNTVDSYRIYGAQSTKNNIWVIQKKQLCLQTILNHKSLSGQFYWGLLSTKQKQDKSQNL